MSTTDVLHLYADHRAGEHEVDHEIWLWHWLPVLGPSASLLAYRMAREIKCGRTEFSVDELGATLGLGRSMTASAIRRLDGFHVLTFASVAVATCRVTMDSPGERLLSRRLARPDGDVA